MKYAVVKIADYWRVTKNNKIVYTGKDKADCEKYAQMAVEDDRVFASFNE